MNRAEGSELVIWASQGLGSPKSMCSFAVYLYSCTLLGQAVLSITCPLTRHVCAVRGLCNCV